MAGPSFPGLVGTLVWFHQSTAGRARIPVERPGDPLPAFVVVAKPDEGRVNLCVFDALGEGWGVQNVRFIECGDPLPDDDSPYITAVGDIPGAAPDDDDGEAFVEPDDKDGPA